MKTEEIVNTYAEVAAWYTGRKGHHYRFVIIRTWETPEGRVTFADVLFSMPLPFLIVAMLAAEDPLWVDGELVHK